jgi:hypothetical protein
VEVHSKILEYELNRYRTYPTINHTNLFKILHYLISSVLSSLWWFFFYLVVLSVQSKVTTKKPITFNINMPRSTIRKEVLTFLSTLMEERQMQADERFFSNDLNEDSNEDNTNNPLL